MVHNSLYCQGRICQILARRRHYGKGNRRLVDYGGSGYSCLTDGLRRSDIALSKRESGKAMVQSISKNKVKSCAWKAMA